MHFLLTYKDGNTVEGGMIINIVVISVKGEACRGVSASML